jgi:N-formylglutamate amidohydrolase
MKVPVLVVHGPPAAEVPLVLDSPHSGAAMPPDFGSVRTEAELREGEDSFIDELYRPATARGVPLLAALFPRTYLDVNRHAGDIDPELLAEPWPQPLQPSAKARIGKALVWRTMDGDRPIYDRRLSVSELQSRIHHYHRPYHDALRGLLDGAHARFGAVWHINCHSMGPTTSVAIEGVDGRPRADFVLGDRDGTTCASEFTAFVRDTLAGHGYSVQVNDPFKGVELVRAWSDPVRGRHSLQVEVNKRLYMDTTTLRKHAGFERLQAHLMNLLDGILAQFGPGAPASRPPPATPAP